jgi:hypothetical protein
MYWLALSSLSTSAGMARCAGGCAPPAGCAPSAVGRELAAPWIPMISAQPNAIAINIRM